MQVASVARQWTQGIVDGPSQASSTMRSSWFRAGSADTFEIAVRWVADPHSLARRPSGHGWSMGEIEITAAGVCLTASGSDGHRQPHVGWYLSPLLGWLADNWHALLHEERYSWRSKTAAPAAIACRQALSWIAADDPAGEENWCHTQAWYQRHGVTQNSLLRVWRSKAQRANSGFPSWTLRDRFGAPCAGLLKIPRTTTRRTRVFGRTWLRCKPEPGSCATRLR